MSQVQPAESSTIIPTIFHRVVMSPIEEHEILRKLKKGILVTPMVSKVRF